MNQGYLKFTGDYSKLKSMGYTFQKLYARNYMSWNKAGVFIFKKGSDITCGDINLYQFIKFIQTHPRCKIHEHGITFYKFYTSDDCKEYEFKPYNEESSKRYLDNLKAAHGSDAPLPHTTIGVGNDLLNLLKQLKALDWYKLVDH